MRFVINGLIALMLLGIFAGVMYQRDVQQQHQQVLDDARADVRRFQREIMLQATLLKVELSEAGYPLMVDPKWFDDDLPTIELLGPGHPWVEIAHVDDRWLDHPPVKVATNRSLAMFWYNPYNGFVRARVPAAMSDAAALKMYNYINESNLSTLFDDESNARH